MRPWRPLHLALLLLLSSGACTSQTTDNFENPPPGPPASCTANAAVTGCAGGSVGYTCTSARPDDGDTNLVCDDGTPGAEGATIYCCAPYGQSWSDCTVDTGIAGCEGASFGFRCSGPETPSEADASLACSAGTPSGGDTLYCCNSEVLPPACVTCQADGAGCDAPTDCCSKQCNAGNTCGANDTCAANDQPCPHGGGDCCSGLCVSGRCASVGCAGAAIEYACTVGATPEELDPSLVCGAGPSALTFCCDLGG
jgi:hypothetical protein